MRNRFFVAGVMAILLPAAVPVVAQTPPSAAKPPVVAKTVVAKTVVAKTVAAKTSTASTKSWTLPRKADGHPDLEGVWTNSTSTPLERPKGLGAKEFYTEQEMADNARREKERAAKAALGRDTEPGTRNDVHYDFGQYGLDRSQAKSAVSRRTSLIVGPEGTIPPLTPEAQKRAAERVAQNRDHQFDGAENRGVSERCIVWPNEGPPMLPAAYNSNLQIVQSPGYVAILQEEIHDVRMIPMDGRPHLPQNIRLWMGDPRGHWEGNTLVVDTTNFSDRTPFSWGGVPSRQYAGEGANLHVVERFTRIDADTIVYEFTVDDATTWTRPWKAEIPMTRIDGPIYEYACQEGNYGLPNNLSGARAAEKAAAGSAKKGSK